MTPKNTVKNHTTARPPVIAIMGHIDHGKSTLLDYIRKTNIVEKEAGGITQHIAAYEVEVPRAQKSRENEANREIPEQVRDDFTTQDRKITFLDTPGHEAFKAIRKRGTKVADIAVLVVSAEDGVKKQTLEALECIKNDGLPYIVAINKIDKPGADIEKTKQSLAENEIYIEGYGGEIQAVPISAKLGTGIPELLDMMLLVAELEELSGDPSKPATGTVIEANVDSKKGISATFIIQDGTLSKGMYVVADHSLAPVRIMENFMGKEIEKATFSSPVKVIGWNTPPAVGSHISAYKDKKDAEEKVLTSKPPQTKSSEVKVKKDLGEGEEEIKEMIVPVIIKADTSGSVEAITHEIEKLGNEKIKPKIIQSGIGPISETDVKMCLTRADCLLVGFNVKADSPAINMATRMNIELKIFNIIYKLTEWIEEKINERTPKTKVEELTGRAKILKLFSALKDKQIIGGKVESGVVKKGEAVKILRRENLIGTGTIRELQEQKSKVGEVLEGKEFGAMIESKLEIAPGDRIESYIIVSK